MLPWMRKISMVMCLALVVSLSGFSRIASASGQDPQQGAFVVVVGGDTVGIEHFTRTEETLEGVVVDEGVGTVTYSATLGPAGTVSRIELQASPPGAPADTPPVQHASIEFQGDSAIAEVRGGGSSQVERVATQAGALPFFNPSFALVEQVLRRSRSLGADSVRVPLFFVMGGQTMPATVQWISADSATFTLAGTELHVSLDSTGHLIRATVPEQDLRVERVEDADQASVRPEWAGPRGSPVPAVGAESDGPDGAGDGPVRGTRDGRTG